MWARLQLQRAGDSVHALGGVSREHEVAIDPNADLVVSACVHLHFLIPGKEPETTPAHAEEAPRHVWPLLQEVQADIWGNVPGYRLTLKTNFGIDRANQTGRGDNPPVQCNRQRGQRHGGAHVDDQYSRPSRSHRMGVSAKPGSCRDGRKRALRSGSDAKVSGCTFSAMSCSTSSRGRCTPRPSCPARSW